MPAGRELQKSSREPTIAAAMVLEASRDVTRPQPHEAEAEAEATTHEAEAEAEATTHEAEAEAEATTHEAEAEAEAKNHLEILIIITVSN